MHLFFIVVSIVGHNLLSPYMEGSGVGDPSPLFLIKAFVAMNIDTCKAR